MLQIPLKKWERVSSSLYSSKWYAFTSNKNIRRKYLILPAKHCNKKISVQTLGFWKVI